MALYTALTTIFELAGVIALSGFLPLRDSILTDATHINQDIPALQIHGEADDVLPYQSIAIPTNKVLKRFMSRLEFKSYPNLNHTISPEETKYVKEFLIRVTSN